MNSKRVRVVRGILAWNQKRRYCVVVKVALDVGRSIVVGN